MNSGRERIAGSASLVRVSRFAHPAGDLHAASTIVAAGHSDERPPHVPADLNALEPAIWPRTSGRADGAVTIGGIDVRDLAKEFGTPLYVVDEEDFRSRCR